MGENKKIERTRIGLRDVRGLGPGQTIWDSEVRGFGARRRQGPAVAYFLFYRTKKGRQRWFTIGKHGSPWTPDMARDEARKLLVNVTEGSDPAADKATTRKAATVGNDTISAALDRYETDLKNRGGDPGNIMRVRAHLSDKLAKKAVGSLAKEDLTAWRDSLRDKLKPASINRTMTALRAALNLAAEDGGGRIHNREAWKTGLKAIGGASKARNVILSEQDVRAVIGAAYRDSKEFGEFVELAAITGARTSQLTRLQGEDVQADFVDPKTRKRQPRLMMPVSRKGSGEKKITHRPVPVPESIANRLIGRTGILLLRPDGESWAKINLPRRFDEAIKGVTLGQPKVTLYALRHTSIVRQLLAGVPIRVVAALHDTSIQMIEQNYSEHIADHADELARPTLETFAEVIAPPADRNVVVSFRKRRPKGTTS
jgi:integrase